MFKVRLAYVDAATESIHWKVLEYVGLPTESKVQLFFATFVGRTLVRKLAASRGFRNLNPVGAAQIREGLES